MDTSKFIGNLYLGKISPTDCVDWANTCLREGKKGENLQKLAALKKENLTLKEVFVLVRYCFAEIGFRCHPSEINAKFQEAKDVAKQILSAQIEPEKGVTKISDIAGQIAFPHSTLLDDWIYLEEGNHPECLEKGWIFLRTNPQKWLEIVKREAKNLVESDYFFDEESFKKGELFRDDEL